MAQKKSVIVLIRHKDRFDLTVPAQRNPHNHCDFNKEKRHIQGFFEFNSQAEKL
jgi:hypothetical protein